jgi:hypothetical protein
LNPQEKPASYGERSENLKRFQRIRSFCWSPNLAVNIPQSSNTEFAIALANDEAQILIATVRSPYTSTFTKDNDWEASVVTHFEVNPWSHQRRPQLLWSFEDYMSNRSYADQLAWSPWFPEHDGHASFIAYITIDELVCQKITSTVDLGNPTIKVHEFSIRLPIPNGNMAKGQLYFDTVIHKKRLTLICQIHNEIVCCSISIDRNHDHTISKCGLEHWDELSGGW